MNIGIDIDEVLAEQLDELIKFYYKKTGQLIPKEKFHTYYWPEVWGISLEEAISIDQEFKESPHFHNLEPLPGAIEGVKKLTVHNKIYLITARPSRFKEKTENWVVKYFGGLHASIIHSGDFHTKNVSKKKYEICQDLGIRLMLEDQKDYALDCAKHGIKVILFDKPWNKNVEHENIFRVNGWKGALETIENGKL